MKKKKITMFILSASLFILFANVLPAFIYMNDIVCAFNESPEKLLLEANVVEGTKYFIKGQISIASLLYEYESQTTTTTSTLSSLGYADKAIADLKLSIEKYQEAKSIGERLGYNENKKSLFESFPYDSYIASHELNFDTATAVKSFLEKFDIIGIYDQNISNIKDIIELLQTIQTQLSAKATPDVDKYWILARKIHETSLFANYATTMGKTTLQQCE